MTFDRDKKQGNLAALAAAGAFVGTSSWKYPGWLGQLYTRDRYVWRGRCLLQMSHARLSGRDGGSSAGGLSVRLLGHGRDHHQTVPQPAALRPACGTREREFPERRSVRVCLPATVRGIPQKLGQLIFEFTQFRGADFPRGREFVMVLDEFLGKLPRGWPYAVEIRNRNFLQCRVANKVGKECAIKVGMDSEDRAME